MATIYKNPKLDHPAAAPSPDGQGYTTYQEPDTRVPPKPLPLFRAIAVDGVPVPEDEILREAQNHPADNPGKALRAAAEALVIRQLLLGEATRRGLAGEGERDEKGRATSADDVAIHALLEAELDVPRAGAEECRRYYENNRQRFMSEPLFEARHILIAAPESDDEKRVEAHRKAQGLCNALASDPSAFAALAALHSACPSGSQGGNLGQLSPGSTVPEFEKALEGMAAGEIAPGPVASRFGYHVIALDRVVPARELPFELVEDRIAAWLEAQSWSRASAQYIAILAGKADISGIEIGAADSPLVQ
ncbi:peptidylprolyl isomerase [Nitratireductor sp. L1-7-SE]|uniref:Parvulin-like PPIase n=1 Tax=Nitratireductor rhodophyticola TaxID=2854036 RepID=A0ABS7R602_9HYPH|nr:peptidylprolyl isomerase [Nitratireductor rhodophyticola]MBY8916361.1 peptidylprolyl isomerase [Nitratireductor rhodophyticola]MBY8921724.1 peptidylprolyl isomerase [Nitratireductor rhodophyticola]